jgi:hypothetical protein
MKQFITNKNELINFNKNIPALYPILASNDVNFIRLNGLKRYIKNTLTYIFV